MFAEDNLPLYQGNFLSLHFTVYLTKRLLSIWKKYLKEWVHRIAKANIDLPKQRDILKKIKKIKLTFIEGMIVSWSREVSNIGRVNSYTVTKSPSSKVLLSTESLVVGMKALVERANIVASVSCIKNKLISFSLFESFQIIKLSNDVSFSFP